MLHTNFQGHWPFGSREDFLRFLPYMGMVAILVMWHRPFEQTFIPLSHGGSTWNLASIGLEVSKENHHHHHHHNHFRALFSSTEGWAFWQVFLEGVLSTQNGSEGQQNPYLASFCHSPALHPMISLACQIFSVQPHSACVLLQSSLCCALHVQTISSYWCGAPHLSPGCQALWEGSLS